MVKTEMDADKYNLCYGCMEEKTDGAQCPHCGYVYGAPYLPSYLAPGTFLSERYILGKLLTYNGESGVYLGYDIITRQKVTIREYMPDAICTRKKNEGQISVDTKYIAQYKTLLSEFVSLNKKLSKMRSLTHIVAVTDLFGDNNTGYAVSPYIGSKTLYEYLKENAGEISYAETKKLIPPILTTLSLIHNEGIIHRGISPETIIINDRGEMMITGFAVSEVRTANTILAAEIFSGYAAPEQYGASNWQDTWTDVYGIAAVIYRMVTGVTPPDAQTRLVSDTLIPPAAVNPSVPGYFSNAIMKGLSLSHDNRSQTITEFVTLLFDEPDYTSERLSSSSTMSIPIPKNPPNWKQRESYRPEPVQKPHKKRLKRRRLFLAVGGATLLCGVLIFLIVLLIGMEDASRNPLEYTDGTSEFSVETPAIIITTAPPETTAATTTKVQGAVYIMNDIVGKNYDLISRSEGYQNVVFVPDYVFSDEVAKGLVISQSIAKDSPYYQGDEMKVEVSLGSKFAEIPDFIGMTSKEYYNLLNERGIKYEEQEFLTTDILEGYVVKISKNAGEMIDNELSEVLIVYVAKNPPKPGDNTSPQGAGPLEPDEEFLPSPMSGYPEGYVPFAGQGVYFN
jgi:serine/threonine-protein kinase